LAVERRLGRPYRGALASTETGARITRDGYQFEPRAGTSDRDVLYAFNEVQTRWFLRQRFARGRSGGVFLDVGAHCGSFSILLESFFDTVLAIEPLPGNYRALERNIELNELGRKIRMFNVAAGAEHANARFFVKR
jgi:hypothetical protein